MKFTVLQQKLEIIGHEDEIFVKKVTILLKQTFDDKNLLCSYLLPLIVEFFLATVWLKGFSPAKGVFFLLVIVSLM